MTYALLVPTMKEDAKTVTVVVRMRGEFCDAVRLLLRWYSALQRLLIQVVMIRIIYFH